MSPFLKWAGGKRWFVKSAALTSLPPYARYIEPFLGSGAVYFHLMPDEAILSDINSDLVNLYTVIRDSPSELKDSLLNLHENHSRDLYYRMRENVPESSLGAATRFLYLNRTCWNGLYRVNKKGNFNVPMGTKTSVLLSSDNFVEASKLLKRASIICEDFEVSIDMGRGGDFMFVDPPYTVQHNNNGFVKYNEQIFSWSDQVRLAEALRRASRRGVKIILTNADHESVRNLYRDSFEYTCIKRASILAGSAKARNSVSEAVFKNF